ncbi:hypothetical protein HF563_00750 [Acidithiobacillus ferridurans]|nr:hypothetical protein [Acidithiobacillus ferridurans]
MNERLATSLLKGSGCYSVIGPSKVINFDRATAFWASFYHLMLRDGATSMKKAILKERVESLQLLFDVRIQFFSRKDTTKGFEKVPFIRT